jgi:hypothetical protein
MLDHHEVEDLAKQRLSEHFTVPQADAIAFVISEVVKRMNEEEEKLLKTMENQLRADRRA